MAPAKASAKASAKAPANAKAAAKAEASAGGQKRLAPNEPLPPDSDRRVSQKTADQDTFCMPSADLWVRLPAGPLVHCAELFASRRASSNLLSQLSAL